MNKYIHFIVLSVLLHGSKALGVEVLGTYGIPKDATIKRMIISPYTSKLLMVLSKEGKEYLQINDSIVDDGADNLTLFESYGERLYKFTVDGKEYIKAGNRSFGPITRLEDHRLSEDGISYLLSYNVGGDTSSSVNVEKMGGRWYVVHDGNVYGPYNNIRSPRLSENGRRCIFSYQRDGMWYVKSGDSTAGPFPFAFSEGISNDDKRWAFKFSNRLGEEYVPWNNRVMGPYNFCTMMVDGDGHYIFKGIKNGNIAFLRNDTSYTQFQNLVSCGWRHLAYGSTTGSYLYKGERIYGPYNGIRHSCKNDFVNRVGFAYRGEDKEYYVYVDGSTFGPFDEAFGPIFSEDEKQYGFVFEDKMKFKVVVNGDIYGPYEGYSIISSTGPLCSFEEPEAIVFSNDGKSFAFNFTKDGKTYIQTNDTIFSGHNYSVKRFSGNGPLCLVYRQKGKVLLLIGNISYGPYEELASLISKDDDFLFAYQQGDSMKLIRIH